MNRLTSSRQTVMALADKARKHRSLDARAKNKIEAAVKTLQAVRPPTIILFGVSQAGKTTLLASLMRGEQFAPTGVGTSTTAVPTELHHVAPGAEERAVVTWKTPEDLLYTIIETVIPFIPTRHLSKLEAFADFFAGGPREERPAEESDEESVMMTLARARSRFDFRNKKHREVLAYALRRAEAAFEREIRENKIPTKGIDELVTARAMLTFYPRYAEEAARGEASVPLGEAHAWMRRPLDWGQRQPHGPRRTFLYGYEELRCLFVKSVRLYVACDEAVAGVRLIDAPGFGISAFDNAVLNQSLRDADAVVLILGSNGAEMTEAQRDQVANLTKNLRDNLYVLWNANKIPRRLAESLLRHDLGVLRMMGVEVPRRRAMVADLRLALRATQWKRFDELAHRSVRALAQESRLKFGLPGEETRDERTLARRVVRRELGQSYELFTDGDLDADDPGAADAALAASNLPAIVKRLMTAVRNAHDLWHLGECVKQVRDALKAFIASFPSPEKVNNLDEQIRQLKALIPLFKEGAVEEKEKLEEGLRKTASEPLKSDLVECVGEAAHLNNTIKAIEGEISQVSHRSRVPGIVHRQVKELFKARCEVWCENVREFKTTASDAYILARYQSANQRVKKLLAQLELDLPDWSEPKVDLGEFSKQFVKAVESEIEEKFPEHFFAIVTKTYEAVKKSAFGLWNKARGLFGYTPEPTPPPFDRQEYKKRAGEAAREFFSERSKLIEGVWDAALGEIIRATNVAFEESYDNYKRILTQRLDESESQRAQQPPILAAEAAAELSELVNALHRVLVMLSQMKEEIENEEPEAEEPATTFNFA